MVVPAGVGLSAQLPGRWVAEKDVNPDPAVTELVEAPYAIVPASAEPVADRVSFGQLEGVAELDEARRGDFYFVTISEPAQSVLSHWVSEGNPAITLLTYEDKYGTSTPAQQRSISLQMMRTSEQVAQFVALRALGVEGAELVPGEVIVDSVLCLDGTPRSCTTWAPAHDVLEPGDHLVSADGAELNTVDDLSAALADRAPGDHIDVQLERPGEDGRQTVQVELIAAPDGSGRTIVGFYPFDTASVSLPFELNIDTGRIGGPSAGLAFTLTLIDELSAGNLTGGQNVAVTGTIGVEGQVGAIGGLAQKTSAVRQAGVDYFLVPAGQSEASLALAQEVAGDAVELIPVATLDEALAALERIGGDPIAPMEPAED